MRTEAANEGRVAITIRTDGRNRATRAGAAPGIPLGSGSITAPRYAEKVNSGPGTAWAAPNPAMNVSSSTQPGSTTSVSSKGSTTGPPPNTRAPVP